MAGAGDPISGIGNGVLGVKPDRAQVLEGRVFLPPEPDS
jgi:hypothetical protein